jgi:hypothetical protein
MAKWLTVAGVALLVLLLLLWRELRPIAARPVAAARPPDLSSPTADQHARALTPMDAAVADPPGAGSAVVASAAPAKLDPRSDEFFYKFDELIPKVLTRNAAKCYEGRHGTLHRNQKLSLKFKVKVKDGEVRVEGVTIKENTLGDAALETCFLQEVQRSTWKDAELPDVGIDDELVLRPERGMKKYWKDNIDYVGAEAPPL